MVSRALLSLQVFIAMSLTVQAHPGHGSTAPDSPAHYIVETEHSSWLVALLVCAAAGAALWQMRRLQKLAAARSESKRINKP